jgi:hypothetical protein
LRWSKLRARLSKVYFGDVINPPTAEEISAAQHHSGHEPTAARLGAGEDAPQ